MAQVLFESKEPLSFIEIKKCLGQRYEKDAVWLNLQSLLKNNIVEPSDGKRKEKKSGRGRRKTSFYRLTKSGEIAISYLNKLAYELREKR